MVFGLIEWDGSYDPTILRGLSEQDIRKTALEVIERTVSPEYIPVPIPPEEERTPERIEQWFSDMWEETTDPMLTIYTESQIVEAV